MPRVLRMPGVAAGADEAVLAEWLVAEGTEFGAGDALATVETDKAMVDIEDEEPGRVVRTLVAAGTTVAIGAPIAVLAAVGEQVADVDALVAELVGASPPPAPDEPDRDPAPVRVEVAPRPAAAPANGRSVAPPATGGRVFASPLARKLAAEAGIPVAEIEGTGPRNRVLRRDVDRALAARAAAPADPSPPEASDGATEVPHTPHRRAVARRLSESKQRAPHFYLRSTVPVDRLLALREEVNEGREQRISLNDLVIKAVALTHRAVPAMNVTWGEETVAHHDAADVAVAVATDRGLLTPVVRGADRLTVADLATRTHDLGERARAGRLRQDELEGGTISVTNLGMYGVEEFAAIINPPHAAILAVGAVREEPVVDAGTLAVGRVMTVTLSVDHRPVDGVVAARWLACFGDLVAHPARILAS